MTRRPIHSIHTWLLAAGIFYAPQGVLAQEPVKDQEQAITVDTLPIAYGKQATKRITAAIATTTGNDLMKTFAPSLGNALYGRIPGLIVMQGSGEPGYDAPALYARGRSSYRDAGVVTIIDGFEAPFNQLVAEEIETVSLLKDAAATALYGMRGANGVLLVTTKKGTNSRTQINFSAQTGWQSFNDFPKPLGSYDYARLFNEALANENKPLLYTDADLEAYRLGTDPYFHPNVNWYDEVLRSSTPVQNFDLNFRGGTKGVRFFVLLNALINQGMYKNTDKERRENANARFMKYNFRTNVDIDITKRLTASLYMGGRIEDRSSLNGTTASQLFDMLSQTPPNAFPVYTPGKVYGGSSVYKNPVATVLGTGMYNNHNRNFQGILTLKHDLDFWLKGLSAEGTVAFTNFFAGTSTQNRTYAMASMTKNANGDTVYTTIGQNTPLTPSEGYGDQWRRSNVRFNLNYNNSFGLHDIGAMVQYVQDKYTIAGNNVPFAYQNYAARATYAFNKKYMAEAVLSLMGTDNFPKGNRFGWFPAVSLGWMLSEESFLKELFKDGSLKLRASYGKSGNDQIGGQRFMYDQYYFMQGGYPFGNNNTSAGGMQEGSLANPGVTWEKKTTANIGIDGTFRKRWHFSADVFAEKRYDIPATPEGTIPGFLGATLPMLNVGEVSNKGFELLLGYQSEPSKAFRYSLESSVLYARNKIQDMSEAAQPYEYLKQTGRAVGQPFGLVSDGFYQAGDFENNGQLKAGLPVPQFGQVRPGDIKYVDQNNDKLIDIYDYKALGYATVPQWNYSFRLGLSYKQFDLDALLQGVADRSVYLNGARVWAFQNNSGATEMSLGRWTPATATTATYPRLTTSANDNNYRFSDFWQRNGNFFKLRSLELRYRVPASWTNKAKLDNASLFVLGNNLFSIDALPGMDPESLSGYPSLRTITVGVRVGL
jgi:TonB-linked SusC/RagA family outer membrane protein